jgi:DNA-directed RNA polymerase subunit RPC12/RpoP
MGKFGNKRIPKFMSGEPIPESHEGVAIHPEILSLKGHGDDHAMIIIKTHDGQEVELRFDYDGDGMLTAQHGDHEYSIPVEIEIVSGMEESKQGKPDYLDFDGDGDKKEPMKKALQDKKKGKAAKTFENFVTECWNPMEESYSPAMSEEAKEAIKSICEDLLIKEAQACDEDHDPMHTYENYLNEVGSYMTKCMTEAAAGLNVNESTAYQCNTCGERAEHEEIEENPRMRCSNCGDRSWSPEY